ncbi:MAG: ABC transporter permease [Nitrososphaerota archaeon]|nr:ABC transporter permease [Nitrososphaerota archaeon]
MNLERVLAFARYEIRRATARKKVLVLVVVTILISTIPVVLIRSVGGSLLPPDDYPYLWVFGVFVVQGFFLPFTALLIAAGSMSEEYEQGTAEVLLSKPVTRDEYFAGKFLGGYALITGVIVLNAILSVTAATFTFGVQEALLVLPAVVLSQVYSALVFFSVAFMSGELVRRSSLSYIIASAVYFTSEVAGIVLRAIYGITGNAFYQQINVFLPTTPVTSLPLQVGLPGLPAGAKFILSFIGSGPTETSLTFSLGLIALYALAATLIARSYFNLADVAKRVA